jgi:hypothetical protein
MNATDKLERLASLCACGVSVHINENRDDYRGVLDFMEIRASCCHQDVNELVAPDILEIMIAKNHVVDVQFYPTTPVGSYSVYHHDLNMALDEALKIMGDTKE